MMETPAPPPRKKSLRKRKTFKVLFIDDKESMHMIFKSFIKYYSVDKKDIEFIVDYFNSVELFHASHSTKYDIAVVDYNIGTSVHQKGDKVLAGLNGGCKFKYILTGMGPDIMNSNGIGNWCLENDVVLLYKSVYEDLLVKLAEEFTRCINVAR